jgi:hypothetical protein
MNSSFAFFKAGSFMERSSISKVKYPRMIPKFVCANCHAGGVAFQFAYPSLDPNTVLSKEEMRMLFRSDHPEAIDPEFIRSCIRRLEDQFEVPVTAGTRFGPAGISVTAKPKDDFDVLPLTNDFFVRRSAAKLLRNEGIDLSWVEPKASGKYAAVADFVQLVVPVVAHCTLVDSESFCRDCKRRTRPDGVVRSKDQSPFLIAGPEIVGLPYFKAIEASPLILAAEFLSVVERLRLKGFVLGETLFPMETD